MSFVRTMTGTITLCCMLALAAGCAKKATKVDATPEPEPQKEQAAPPPAAPTERESFETVDPEAQIRAVLQTVYFDYDQSALRSETIDRLQMIGKLLDEKTTLNLLCEGHADERGTNEYNIGLGDRRARAVRDWLVNYGIGERRFETTSFGRERPARSDCGGDESCHSMNRRVEFKVLAK